MQCPACQAQLQTTNLLGDAKIILDVCPSCHGAWFDARELTQLDGSVWGNIERHPFHTVEGDHPQANCPKCTESMYDGSAMAHPLEPLSPGDAPDLIIDRCPSCFGFWLDHGELERIVQIANRYDQHKRTEREVDRTLVGREQAAISILEAWPHLDEEIQAQIIVLARAKHGGSEHNALRLPNYDALPDPLKSITDSWFSLSDQRRGEILELLPEEMRPAATSSSSTQTTGEQRLTSRPQGWSWLKWMTYRFKSALAENADDIF